MPKDIEQSNNLVSRNARCSRYHPYNEQHIISGENSLKDEEINVQKKEWDDTVCLICMEHPHNVVLLLCSHTTIRIGNSAANVVFFTLITP